MKTLLTYLTALVCTALLSFTATSSAATVEESEALAVADAWYAQELKSPHLDLEPSDRDRRLASIGQHRILGIDAKSELIDRSLQGGEPKAYAVIYPEVGFVVVSADDRLHPILVFSASSEFSWGHPSLDFLPYFLGKNLSAAARYLDNADTQGIKLNANPYWTALRGTLHGGPRLQGGPVPQGQPLYILLPTARWGQGPPYNQVVSAQNGNNAAVPVGCVATALAITMRYHSWPPTGNGAHNYCDDDGTVQFCHTVNFGALNLNWGGMPTSALIAQNPDVANLMYACGVMVDTNYEPGGSGAGCGNIERVIDHFSYRSVEHIGGNFEQHIVASLRAELPVPGCNPDHAFVFDGYRSDPSPFFHINPGWAGFGVGWYNLNLTPDGAAGRALDEALPYMAPTAYVYADGLDRDDGDGTPQSPYRTLAEGIEAATAGGQLWIRSGSYTGAGNAPITIVKPLTLRAYFQGPVTIGP